MLELRWPIKVRSRIWDIGNKEIIWERINEGLGGSYSNSLLDLLLTHTIFLHNLLPLRQEVTILLYSSIMDAPHQPASSSSDRDEPLTPEENPKELPLEQDLAPQQPSIQDSGTTRSGRIRRWSEPQDDFVPMSPMFKLFHRRHLSMPVTHRSRADPRSTSVYKWLDAIAEAGGVQPLEGVPFHSPSHSKLSSLKAPVTVENWEHAVEEEVAASPTDVVDPDTINLGISKSGNTVTSDDFFDGFIIIEDTEVKDAPGKMDMNL